MTSNIYKRLILLIILVMSIYITCSATKRALLVGISDYPKQNGYPNATWSCIHGANDISLMSSTLKSKGFVVDILANANATASRIRKAMKNLVSKTKPGDIVYLHFSTHGQPVEDTNGDERDGWDESIVPYDALKCPTPKYKGQNHILDDEIRVVVDQIRAKAGAKGFVYVVIDACHAGDMQKGDEEDDEEIYERGVKDGFSPSGKRFVPKISSSTDYFKVTASPNMANVCYLEACRPYQVNREIKVSNTFYGPMSYYINAVLKSCDITSNTMWVDNVKQKMQADVKLSNQNMVIEKSN